MKLIKLKIGQRMLSYNFTKFTIYKTHLTPHPTANNLQNAICPHKSTGLYNNL